MNAPQQHPTIAEAGSLLIILMGSLGDVVRGLSIVAPLKAAQPRLKITWLVEPACAEIVRCHPQIDDVLIFERGRGIGAVTAVVRELRRRRFDITLDMQRHIKSGLFSLFSGARRRVGFHRRNAKEFNWLFNNDRIGALGDENSKLVHYHRFLHHLGVPIGAPLVFGFEQFDTERETARHAAALSRPFVVAVMGSSWSSKNWTVEGYQRVIDSVLRESQLDVVLVGDKSHAQFADPITAASSSGRIHNLVGATSLRELVGILKRARVCFGPDCGPAHLAGAVGTRYVALFGPTSAQRVAPYGSETLAISSVLGCAPCYRRVCPGLDRICMRLHAPHEVWRRLASQL